jgi:hypothetical protein
MARPMHKSCLANNCHNPSPPSPGREALLGLPPPPPPHTLSVRLDPLKQGFLAVPKVSLLQPSDSQPFVAT